MARKYCSNFLVLAAGLNKTRKTMEAFGGAGSASRRKTSGKTRRGRTKMMNKKRRTALNELLTKLEEIKNQVEEIMDEEQTALENLPEAFQEGEKGDTMQEAIDNLSNAMDAIDEATNTLMKQQTKERRTTWQITFVNGATWRDATTHSAALSRQHTRERQRDAVH